ncbi:MAG: hypothetical protein JWM91_1032 [Rhodospirillales bacterium]|nr:hypothetical protein [Rhodospirillales bacterium]
MRILATTSMLASIALMPSVALTAATARANDATTLYHVQDTTYGCADPYATRVLTNPDRPSPTTIKSTFSRGRCVSITPKSPWRFISRDEDVVLMEYAGDAGQPGSYYMRAEQLIGPNGGHPGDVQPPSIAAAPSGPALTNPASETALAPETQPAPQGMPAMAPISNSQARPMWGVTEILLLVIALGLAVAGGYVLGRRGVRS